ncbi:MAG: hypothetical protein LBL66_06885 [Clostridiales bacterium]|jgi:hypothetical protein|nr:hypothetical protein [Clostridiales bacterium]
MTEPNAMREIHEIRECLSREKNGLTIEERLARTNAATLELQKKYGFRVIDKLPERKYL